jgi:hypothetical protein
MASCKTTYQAELLDCQAATLNSRSTGRGCSSSASASVSPAAAAPARPGYLTTAAASQLPIAEAFAASLSLSAAISPRIAALKSQAAQGARNSTSNAGYDMPTAAVSSVAPPALPTAGGSTGCRPSKADAFLAALDQHSRGRLPGYTGHRPQHNVSLELLPPTKLTTWGAASQEALRARGAECSG